MMREALAEKIIVLGIDGFDPSLAKKFMDEGKMPALQTFVQRGAQREDLVLLGAMPTVTPPMWTTLATGAYPRTHGITCFWAPVEDKLDETGYNLDSRTCRAEQLWNVTAEAGLKTLVWHWPGSSWPPTSDSPNLHVVEGTQPVAVNFGVANIDWEKFVVADASYDELRFKSHVASNTGAGCIINDLDGVVAKEEEVDSGQAAVEGIISGKAGGVHLIIDEADNEVETLGKINFDQIQSPIKPASGWANAPEDAKEFIVLTSEGRVRRPALILKNEQGKYDRVALYRSKKDIEPLVVLAKDVMAADIVDDILVEDEKKTANRNLRLLELAEDGSSLRLWMSSAFEIANDDLWHPKALHQEIMQYVGHIPALSLASGSDWHLIEKLILPCWEEYVKWQADCLNYFISKNDYQMIFSHLHNVDGMGHQFWHFAKHQEEWGNDENIYQRLIEEAYLQTDRYLAQFVHLLDEGWTVIITSDHGLISTKEMSPILGEVAGVNVKVMQELGYTVLQKDAEGNDLHAIDWSKTRAIAVRGNHIYINLKGRNSTGIVEPEDQYALEEQIISDLYAYRDKRTGRRVVAMAMRNQDAVVIGMGGSQCGDILYWLEADFTQIHCNAWSTFKGYSSTSVSPIFIAAGKGIKAGYRTDRVIREVDVAPTLAVLAGVRMPAQCEGAPVYQILASDF